MYAIPNLLPILGITSLGSNFGYFDCFYSIQILLGGKFNIIFWFKIENYNLKSSSKATYIFKLKGILVMWDMIRFYAVSADNSIRNGKKMDKSRKT